MARNGNWNRREFLVGGALGAVAFAFAHVAAAAGGPTPTEAKKADAGKGKKADGGKAAQAPLPAGQKAVNPADPVAKSLHYVDDNSKVDAKKNPRFAPTQSCKNCVFYTKRNDGWGTCQLITTGVVAASGWCASWTGKPGAK